MRGQSEGGEAGAGEVEERGHRERVVAYAAMRQERADVGHERDVARGPEAVTEGGGDGEAEEGEGGMKDRE